MELFFDTLLCWIFGHKWNDGFMDVDRNDNTNFEYICTRCGKQRTEKL